MKRMKNKRTRLDRPVGSEWTIDLELLTAAFRESLLVAQLRARRPRRLSLPGRKR